MKPLVIRSGVLALCIAMLATTSSLCETNQVLAGIGGLNNGTVLGGDGTGAATIALNGTGLALVKQARDSGGTVLANGTPVAGGTTLYFVLYVDNSTGFPANDIRITDLLDESAFSYAGGSLEWAGVASGSNDATIWAGPWFALTDPLGAPDDGASALDSAGPAGVDSITVGAVPGQANSVLDVAASTLWAVRFQVSVN